MEQAPTEEVSHLDMFKQARPLKLSIAVQNDLEKYAKLEEPAFGNKNAHIKMMSGSDESEEMDSDLDREFEEDLNI